ncbi:MAG: class I SAM-dependent methyltransferase [Dehalococcoidia bacterium]
MISLFAAHSSQGGKISRTIDSSIAGPLQHIHEHPELDAWDLRAIREVSPAHPRILDIGAGRGGFVMAARALGCDALGVDMEPTAPELWRSRGVWSVLGRAPELPFADASFDVVRLKEIIEHLDDPLATVRAAARLIAPGGCLIAHVPSVYSQFFPIGNFWDDYTHVRPFSRTGLERLFADGGLAVLRIEGYVAGRSPLERAAGKLLARVLPHTYRVIARRADPAASRGSP